MWICGRKWCSHRQTWRSNGLVCAVRNNKIFIFNVCWSVRIDIGFEQFYFHNRGSFAAAVFGTAVEQNNRLGFYFAHRYIALLYQIWFQTMQMAKVITQWTICDHVQVQTNCFRKLCDDRWEIWCLVCVPEYPIRKGLGRLTFKYIFFRCFSKEKQDRYLYTLYNGHV